MSVTLELTHDGDILAFFDAAYSDKFIELIRRAGTPEDRQLNLWPGRSQNAYHIRSAYYIARCPRPAWSSIREGHFGFAIGWHGYELPGDGVEMELKAYYETGNVHHKLARKLTRAFVRYGASKADDA